MMSDIEQNLEIIDELTDVEIESTMQVVDVSEVEVFVVESQSAFAPLGEPNEQLKHSLLTERELNDQHPITAITGLRDELDQIEALDTVYSDKRLQADYYLWEDDNVLKEDRVGCFVSVCSDINKIKLCTSDNDIFGVTVDSAGFIGAQSDIKRDDAYGLVAYSGVVHVRCELPVNIGDYVVSNDYGYAQSNTVGYKVVGRHRINGIEYAEITLNAPMDRICDLSDEVGHIDQRMDDAETNIVAAINMANAAYNKAGEATSVSEEVLKNALEALQKSEDIETEVDKFLNETAPSISETWEQAQTIAESAAASAITAKDEAIATANDAWAKSESVENEFHSLTAKIDQYSVGEYSQAYGLTLEQTRSILKAGMIYVPTKHLETDSHTEVYLYTDENGDEQEAEFAFTPHNHYEWNGDSWVEYGNTVAFFSEEPVPSRVLTYWYIDSNTAPEGYEAHALYIWDEGWQKVNILEGNVNNRMTSMIRQTTDKISMEITNARGSSTSLSQRLSTMDAAISSVASWTTEDGKYNLAAIEQKADDDGSSLALVVAGKDGETILNGASIVLGTDTDSSSIYLDADYITFNGLTTFLRPEDVGSSGSTIIDGARITTGIIQSENYSYTSGTYSSAGTSFDLTNGNIISKNLSIINGSANITGKITATSGRLGTSTAGWTIDDNSLYHGSSFSSADMFLCTGSGGKFQIAGSESINGWMIKAGSNFGVTKTGALYCDDAHLTGVITATGGNIGGCEIKDNILYIASANADGLKAGSADITGKITATGGSIGSVLIDAEGVKGLKYSIPHSNDPSYNAFEFSIGEQGIKTAFLNPYAESSGIDVAAYDQFNIKKDAGYLVEMVVTGQYDTYYNAFPYTKVLYGRHDVSANNHTVVRPGMLIQNFLDGSFIIGTAEHYIEFTNNGAHLIGNWYRGTSVADPIQEI